MSKWDDFKDKVGKFADKTAQKTREITDAAALKLKIANKEADRDQEYKKLGKLAYAKLKNLEGANTEELTEKISEALTNLDRILLELNELKVEEAKKKAEKDAEKEAKKAAKATENNTDEDDGNDELDMKVMSEFREARKTADEKYEEAKVAVEEAEHTAKEAKNL